MPILMDETWKLHVTSFILKTWDSIRRFIDSVGCEGDWEGDYDSIKLDDL